MPPRTDRTFRTQSVERQTELQGVALASFRARALAFLVDSGIVVLLALLPALWRAVAGREAGQPMSLAITIDSGSLLTFVVLVAYFSLATFLGKGATPGKKLLGIRVVSLVHGHMSLWHCVERALGYAASSLEAGFGFVQYFTHPNHQTVHDRIAETIVVVSRSGATAEQKPERKPPSPKRGARRRARGS